MRSSFTVNSAILVLCLLLTPLGQALGQDIEPRRWTPIPPGLNIIGAAYGRLQGDVFFNPVMLIEDAEVEGHFAAISYVR